MMIKTFRLTNEPGGLGLSCSPAGLAFAGVPLFAKAAAGFEPRGASEIATLLKAAYGTNGGPILSQSRLEAIAQALNNRDFGLATIAAVQMRIPELSAEAAARVAHAEEMLSKYNYDPNEPRDWHGRWTRDGSAGPVNIAALGSERDQGIDAHASGRPKRFADNALSDAAAPSDGADGDHAQAPKSPDEAFERKYDHLGPVDFAKEVIRFGDWLAREGKNLSPTEKEQALAEHSFLYGRLSFRLVQSYESMTVQGNLQSAALTLYQGAVNAGLVRPGPSPDPMLVAGATSAAISVGNGPPARPYRMPGVRGAPAAATRIPKEVERPVGLGEAEKPVKMTLGGVEHTMPDWHMEEISYTKRTDAEREALRAEFNKSVRKAFVKDLAENHTAALRDAGMSDEDIALMADGQVPSRYRVHHMLPLDDGGANATSNLVFIKQDPDHKLLTNYQNEQTRGISAGQTRKLEWPVPDWQIRIWPKTPDGGAYPTMHKVDWPMPASRLRIWRKIPDGGPHYHRALTRRTGMSDIDDLLAAIDVRERKFGHTMRPPASPDAIERLRRLAWDKFRTDLPEGYLTFLSETDGLDFNGYSIYAATEDEKPYWPGFVESNVLLGAPHRGYVFYGDTGDELYAQHLTSRAWHALDRPSLSVLESFPSFDAMLGHVLREAVAGLPGF
jgi:hypothetical protein